MKTAQVSLEYLVILGLTITIILGAVYVFFDYVRDSSQEVVSSRINSLGTNILQVSESIYGIGNGTWIELDIQYPNEIIEAYTSREGNIGELVFVIESQSSLSESVFFSDVIIVGAGADLGGGKTSLGRVQPGKAKIKIESRGDFVLLNSS